MTVEMQRAFEAIGADVEITVTGHRFEIDVQQTNDQEVYQLTLPREQTIFADAMDVKPKLRHLVLDVSGWQRPFAARYLCGHDERHWFVANVPFDAQTVTVRGAMEALKPEIVRREQKRKGVKHRRHRRKTTAYVRQGEWFFLPRPMMHVGELAINDGILARRGGKPHRVQWFYQPQGRDEMYARGAVSHPDHETLYLQVWHRVVQNNEVEPTVSARQFARMKYVD